MKFLSQTFAIRTERGPQFVDITNWVTDAIKAAGLSNGFAVVFHDQLTGGGRREVELGAKFFRYVSAT